MKTILLTLLTTLLLPHPSMAQTYNYTKQWQTIDSANKKGLTTTAHSIAKQIFAQANKDNNGPQLIKATMAIVGYNNTLIENSEQYNYTLLDSLVTKAKAPTKNILQSLLAEYIHNYYNNNRFLIQQHTAVNKDISGNILTWSYAQFQQVIAMYYKASLANEKFLQAIPTADYAAIISKGENTQGLRPTLYDLLAFRAVNYFSSGTNTVTTPINAFNLNSEKAFAKASIFAITNIPTTDTTSTTYQALRLYQKLVQFHGNDTEPSALIDADILRLQFVHTYSTLANKDSLYRNALQVIATAYVRNPLSATALYLIAQNIYANVIGRDKYLTIKSICESAIKNHPKSEGGINAYNQLQKISNEQVELYVETVNLPQQPFRALVQYKNVEKLYTRILKFTKAELSQIQKIQHDLQWRTYAAKVPIRSETYTLPTPQFGITQSVEVKVDALPMGSYHILTSTTPDFASTQNELTITSFTISNIALIKNEDNECHLLHRLTGKPLAAATVQTFVNTYNYRNNEYDEIKDAKLYSNVHGFFRVEKYKGDNYRQISMLVTHEKDSLYVSNTMNSYARSESNVTEPKNKSVLYTDRAIYRPGQLVYYKGIIITTTAPNNWRVVPNTTATVKLYDANYQPIATQKVTTNAYGSYSGSFVMPTSGLLGQFFIQDSTNSADAYIRVEEYKRPKFVTTIPTPTATYSINDSIKVIGTATALAGNVISGATVVYRVVRNTRFPIWYDNYYYKGLYNNQTPNAEIANGTTTTNTAGQYTIPFVALPNATDTKNSQPIYNYTITADVTDVNGETRSASVTIPVSYQSLQLQLKLPLSSGMPQVLTSSMLQQGSIISTNIAGNAVASRVTLIIQQLQAPINFVRNRYWERPTHFLYTRVQYKQLFAYDDYDAELKPETWAINKEIFNSIYSTDGKTALNWPNQLADGYYSITLTANDVKGEPVKSITYIQIANSPNSATSINPLTVVNNKPSYQPNDTLKYAVNTFFTDAYILHQNEYMLPKVNKPLTILNNKNFWLQYLQPTKATTSYAIPVTDTDRGGIATQVVMIRHNSFFTMSTQADIPYTNKQLQLSFSTFRNTTLPGSQEEYTLKVSGNKGEKVAAEVLATMYDASLDLFAGANAQEKHTLNIPNLYENLYTSNKWSAFQFYRTLADNIKSFENYKQQIVKQYAQFYLKANGVNTNTWYSEAYTDKIMVRSALSMKLPGVSKMETARLDDASNEVTVQGMALGSKQKNNSVTVSDTNENVISNSKKENTQPPTPRKNFNETGFFLPNLTTDTAGNINIKYTIPEALTSWNLQALAHTKDLQFGYISKSVLTQKPLMVQPNLPRFMRQGDRVVLSIKVVNLTDKEITGTSQLQLSDAVTNVNVDGLYKNLYANQYFTVPAMQSVPVIFTLEVPYNTTNPLVITVNAISTTTGITATDAEENIIPVLTNQVLVTEAVPFTMTNNGTKKFTLPNLLQMASSGAITQSLTAEYSTNPAWYAVQALPYLMQYPYECAEQTFSKYYANALASKIISSNPAIAKVYKRWETADSASLQSNLYKNETLKQSLLTETPWLQAAQSETQQQRNIANLFNLKKLETEQLSMATKLQQMQSSNGGFMWFAGAPPDRYMTQYILTGLGHLQHLDVPINSNLSNQVIPAALTYTDAEMLADYNKIKKENLEKLTVSNFTLQYLYMRSFYPTQAIQPNVIKAYNYYLAQASMQWKQQSLITKAMLALTLQRSGNKNVASDIITSLQQTAITSPELGMYWKENQAGYYWHQAPIETQALLIEAFSECTTNQVVINNLKQWLLINKQTNNWPTTKATATACYALLLQGANFASNTAVVQIKIGSNSIDFNSELAQAGTGYNKTTLPPNKIVPSMGNITVTQASNTATGKQALTWGAVYWQYLQAADKVTANVTAALQVQKQLYKQVLTNTGLQLVAVSTNTPLQVGDKLVSRIIINADRDMEYLHLKDMRSSGTEPLNVLSQYKYGSGLGYYESTTDVANNYFISYLPKGTYVFENVVFVSHKGDYTNGVATLQCMYAPQYTTHSNGVRLVVE